MHLEKSNVSSTLTRLEDRGLVGEKQRALNVRLLDISLTDRGRILFQALLPMANCHQKLLTERLALYEKALFSALLKKLSVKS